MKKPKFPGQLIGKMNAKKHKKISPTENVGGSYFPQNNIFGGSAGGRGIGLQRTSGARSLQGGASSMPSAIGVMHAKKHHKKHNKKRKTVSVTYKPGNYKEGEEIKAIRALNEMHKGMKDKKHRKHKKNWIAGAIKHPGALHRQLGVKQGRKIPAKTLARAASKGGKLGRRARLAETLKGLHK